jgi:hypothetical protein
MKGVIWIPNNGFSFASPQFGHVYGWILVVIGIITFSLTFSDLSFPPPLTLQFTFDVYKKGDDALIDTVTITSYVEEVYDVV